MRRIILGPALFVSIVAAGCEAPRARVHGTITFQNKPLAGAVVTFFTADNMTASVDTGPDGRYEIVGVRRGVVRVSVQMPPPPQKPRPDPVPGKIGDDPGRAEDRAKAARLPAPPTPTTPPPAAGALPAKYSDPNTSGLSFELKDPDQKYDIPLT